MQYVTVVMTHEAVMAPAVNRNVLSVKLAGRMSAGEKSVRQSRLDEPRDVRRIEKNDITGTFTSCRQRKRCHFRAIRLSR